MKLIPLEEVEKLLNTPDMVVVDKEGRYTIIDPIDIIDELIKVLEYNKKVTESSQIFLQREAQEYILKELKSRLTNNK